MHILLICREEKDARLLSGMCRDLRCEVTEVVDGAGAEDALDAGYVPDRVLCATDLGQEDVGGLLHWLHSRLPTVPIIPCDSAGGRAVAWGGVRIPRPYRLDAIKDALGLVEAR